MLVWLLAASPALRLAPPVMQLNRNIGPVSLPWKGEAPPFPGAVPYYEQNSPATQAMSRVAPTTYVAMTQEIVSQLRREADEPVMALDRLERERSAEEAAFKEQIASGELTGDLYDAMLTAHFQQRHELAMAYKAAKAGAESKMRKAELAEQLFAAEQVTRAKRVELEAAEERLRAERRVTEEAAREEAKIREHFLTA
jgi:hypothetical protein